MFSRQAVTAGPKRRIPVGPDVGCRRSYSSEPRSDGGIKRERFGGKGLEWDPQAMKNTSILIIVITCLPRTSAASLFLYLHLSPTDRDTHKHAADTFQIVTVTAEEKINPAFRHRTPVLTEFLWKRDKKKNHFLVWSGVVPHQCFCRDAHKWFLFLRKCKLITDSCSG